MAKSEKFLYDAVLKIWSMRAKRKSVFEINSFIKKIEKENL